MIRLLDTRTGVRQPLSESGPISLYVCGITPYDTTHLGHAFTFVQFDALVRVLRWLGREVIHVQNVTDVDDSILARAGQVGVGWRELGDEELARYRADMRALNVAPPTFLVRATEVIPSIEELAARLIGRGCAYAAGGTVFFRVRSDPKYGELSKLGREQMLEVASRQDDADLDDPRKEDPLDVALWKRWTGDPGEPWWESRWGRGRPGWTIECAAINLRYLGPQVDVHGGGTDLAFPHHETEIAIVEGATGLRPFVRSWAHTAMIREAGEKMSKSLGNMVFVGDLIERFGADGLRLYLLSHHYREAFEFDERELEAAAERAERLRARLDDPEAAGAGVEARAAFVAAIEDDFDVPRAIAVLEDASGATTRELAGVLGLHHEARIFPPPV